jgi:hypothetical protein
MSNARSIIKRSLQSIGKIGRGRDMTAEQAADGLELLNQLIASWKGEGLTIPFRTTEELTYSTSKTSYTIGTGGDLSTVRPTQIISAFHRDGSGSDYPMRMMTLNEFNEIRYKDISTYPDRLYYESVYPLGVINFDYQPNTDFTLHLTSLKEITEFTDLDAEIELPAEYDRALRSNLSIETAPDYGQAVSKELMFTATESKANIKRLNSSNRDNVMTVDIGLRKGNIGNILNGYN